MKYNVMEVHEADGAEYELSPTPKKMLVWNSDNLMVVEREVLGFFKERWIAAAVGLQGVCEWEHAAEIPKEQTLAEYVKELRRTRGKAPFVVHPNGIPITREESCYAIGVPEQKSLLYIDELSDLSNTFVVLPGCIEIVKSMFRILQVDNRNYAPHADVVFFKEEEA